MSSKITVEFHPAVLKDLKRLPKPFSQHLQADVVSEMEQGVLKGIPLVGPFRTLRKIRIRHEGVAYRLIYHSVNPSRLIVLMIGKRGEFYQRLRQRLG